MPSIKKILIPTDFSENSSNVFKYVQKMAENHQAKVDLIHVIPRMSYLDISEAVMGNPFKVQKKFEELKEKLKAQLTAELKENFKFENRGEVIIGTGAKVTEVISKHEKQNDYDLLVIGSRGKGNNLFSRGSVTQKLIHLSNTPVLSFQREFDKKLRRILVPTDGSKTSYEALCLALSFAERHKVSLTLYSVLEFDFDKIKLMGGDTQLYEYAIQNQKEEILENLKEEIENSKEYSFYSTPSIEGALVKREGKSLVQISIVIEQNISAHQAIVDYANQNVEMVVMTTHGRSGIAKLLIGSVAEKVVRYLEVPVLTITPDFAKKK